MKAGAQAEVAKEILPLLSEKEFSILLASLLYSADKCANTVGHYDAYIKGHDIVDSFSFDLISPYKADKSNIHISREDANALAKKLKCDKKLNKYTEVLL